jgi:hypothetical protein
MDRGFEIMENHELPTHAITPDEALGLKEKLLPPFVMRVWNKLIAENLSGKTSIVMQSDAVDALTKFCKRDEIFEKGYLEVEAIFRKAGWKVFYDRPGFNETYDATFEFTAK